MSPLIYVTAAVICILLILLVASLIWLRRAYGAQVKAETEVTALTKGQEKKSVGDKIMAEPTAFEPAWIKLARERMRDRDRES